MQDNINKFKTEAFSTPESFQADVDDSFIVAPYVRGLRTQGMIVGKYTSGDTRYQPEQPLPNNYLTTLPSKISKRYSPLNIEQNTGMPIPPDPSFMKANSHVERIVTVRDLIMNKDVDDSIVEKSKSAPISGIDFARTHSEAALFLSKLGKDVSYEAHHSAIKKDGTTNEANSDIGESRIATHYNTTNEANSAIGESRIAPMERIVVKQSDVKKSDFDSKIVLNSIPEKNYDNLNLVAVGYEHLIDSQVNRASKPKEEQIKTNKNFIATSKLKPTNAVSLNSVLSNSDTEDGSNSVDFFSETSNEQTISSTRSQSKNLVNLVESKMSAKSQPEIVNIEDAPVVIRQVIEDFTQMKEEQQKERAVQMKTVENRVKKIIQSELPEEVEDSQSAAVEIREIIREVVENHPNLIQRNNNQDMEFSVASRDKFLRVQIEQELRDKFESRIADNNKLMEKQNRVMFEEMMHRFLNP